MSKFNFISTDIAGLIIVEPKIFGDHRGFFMETYQRQEFVKAGICANFVQDNHSKSTKGVLRGLHFQKSKPQGKLVRVISGEVYDVAVDLRNRSATYGQWVGVTLSADNKKQFWIPKGFAHGFLVLSDVAEFVYKCDEYYYPEDEGGLLWNDPKLDINWPILDANYILSDKDLKYVPFCRQQPHIGG